MNLHGIYAVAVPSVFHMCGLYQIDEYVIKIGSHHGDTLTIFLTRDKSDTNGAPHTRGCFCGWGGCCDAIASTLVVQSDNITQQSKVCIQTVSECLFIIQLLILPHLSTLWVTSQKKDKN